MLPFWGAPQCLREAFGWWFPPTPAWLAFLIVEAALTPFPHAF